MGRKRRNPNQLGLFDTAADESAPFVKGSKTSKAAADQMVDEGELGKLRAKVLAHLRKRKKKGATDEEMQDALGMNPSTQRPRRIELVDRGLVADSGQKRKTRSGRNAVVWIAAAEESAAATGT